MLHIRLGDMPFCQCSLGADKDINLNEHMFKTLQRSATCSHKHNSSAEAQVQWLHDHGHPEAKIVEGSCDEY
jgi:hypothetical protein